MRTLTFAALVVFTGMVHGGGTETEKNKNREEKSARDVSPSRLNKVVLAVRKVRESVAAVKVLKHNSRRETIGTGVIVDERGYIVTNRHVVQSAARINVALFDQKTYEAEVEFEEPTCDLAVLKIKTTRQLKALRLGPANDLLVGEDVIAIGHPFGYQNTVSKGIISAVGREIEMPGGVTLTNLIQTTASINPGNSGGPLLNIDGELIGINVALRQDAQNIAFALNADMVQQVLSRKLRASRRHGLSHGLVCQESVLPQGDLRSRVVVRDVTEGTPAAEAGLQEGDQIVRLGDFTVGNRFDVERALWPARVGEKVSVVVKRNGRELNVKMLFERSQTARR